MMIYQVVLARHVDEQVVALLVRGRPDEQFVVTQKIDYSEDGVGV